MDVKTMVIKPTAQLNQHARFRRWRVSVSRLHPGRIALDYLALYPGGRVDPGFLGVPAPL